MTELSTVNKSNIIYLKEVLKNLTVSARESDIDETLNIMLKIFYFKRKFESVGPFECIQIV